MYIRESNTQKKNKIYTTHKLVQSYHTEKGSRQRVIMSLGKLDLPRNRWGELAAILESRINGQLSLVEEDDELVQLADNAIKHNDFMKSRKKQEEVITEQADIQQVDINSTQTTFYRSLGPELVADSFWDTLEFDIILSSCGFE